MPPRPSMEAAAPSISSDELDELRDKVKQLERENKTYRKDLERLEDDNDVLQRSVSRLEGQLDDMVSRSDLDKATAERDSAQSEAATLRGRVGALEVQLEERQATTAKVLEQVDVLKDEIALHTDENRRLKSELDSRSEGAPQAAALQAVIEGKDRLIEDQTAELERLQDELRRLKKTVSDYQRGGQSVPREQHDELRQRARDLEVEVERLAAFEGTLAEARAEIERLGEALDQGTARAEGQAEALARAHEAVESTRVELDAAREKAARVEKLEADVARLNEALAGASGDRERLAAVESELQTSNANLEAARADLDAAGKELETLRGELASTQASLDAVRGEVDSARGAGHRHAEQLAGLEADLNAARERNAQLVRELDAQVTELDAARQAAESARALEAELAEARKKLAGAADIQAEVGHMAERIAASAHQLEAARSRTRQLEEQLTAAQAELQAASARPEPPSTEVVAALHNAVRQWQDHFAVLRSQVATVDGAVRAQLGALDGLAAEDLSSLKEVIGWCAEESRTLLARFEGLQASSPPAAAAGVADATPAVAPTD